MAQLFRNFQTDELGNVPAGMVLKRNAIASEYQIAENAGVRFLRYLSAASSSAKGMSYSGAPSSGATEIYAEILDIDSSSPASGRVVLFASDSPDNEYGVYYERGAARLDLYSRSGGTFATVTRLTINNAPYPATEYYHLLLKVVPGTPNLLYVKLWPYDQEEPAEWTIETDSNALTLSAGWSGHVGFATDDEVRYRAIGIGTDGDPAPREPIAAGITLSVDSISLSMVMDSVTLTQANQLAVDSIELMTSLDAVTLQQAHVLNPDDISLSSFMDAVTLSSAGQLSVDSLQLSIGLESVELQQANVLSVDNLLLDTALESPDLSVGLTLVPDSIWLSALLDQVMLTQSHLLMVDDLTQSISLDNVTLTVAGQVIGPGTLTIGITGPSISIGISP